MPLMAVALLLVLGIPEVPLRRTVREERPVAPDPVTPAPVLGRTAA